jgi:hypothetical protein
VDADRNNPWSNSVRLSLAGSGFIFFRRSRFPVLQDSLRAVV